MYGRISTGFKKTEALSQGFEIAPLAVEVMSSLGSGELLRENDPILLTILQVFKIPADFFKSSTVFLAVAVFEKLPIAAVDGF